jgi:hypothetical protein
MGRPHVWGAVAKELEDRGLKIEESIRWLCLFAFFASIETKTGPEITGISGPGEFSLSGESYVSTLFVGPRDPRKENQNSN